MKTPLGQAMTKRRVVTKAPTITVGSVKTPVGKPVTATIGQMSYFIASHCNTILANLKLFGFTTDKNNQQL
ncbi:hypothetical protein QUF63_03870 [Anaerolineales bacterium HSG25]|nr:hypothetical protein [Anaerolineales bacterium HSG25]